MWCKSVFLSMCAWIKVACTRCMYARVYAYVHVGMLAALMHVSVYVALVLEPT